MNKKERVVAAIRQEAVDYVPCGFSLHFPEDRNFGEAGVRSHLDFFRDTDTDIIKIMNDVKVFGSGLDTVSGYCASIKDFPWDDAYVKAQSEFASEILSRADSTAFATGTLHGLISVATFPMMCAGMGYFESLALMVRLLREDPVRINDALRIIADKIEALEDGYVKAGVDGIYYSSFGGERGYFTDEEFETYIAPLDKEILKRAKDQGKYAIVHICRPEVVMERYLSYTELGDVFNWKANEGNITLEEGRRLFKGKTIFGGLPDRFGVLSDGTDEEIKAKVTGIITGFGKKGFIFGADCTISTEQDMHKLKLAIETSRSL